jgi:hypothetical protein
MLQGDTNPWEIVGEIRAFYYQQKARQRSQMRTASPATPTPGEPITDLGISDEIQGPPTATLSPLQSRIRFVPASTLTPTVMQQIPQPETLEKGNP